MGNNVAIVEKDLLEKEIFKLEFPVMVVIVKRVSGRENFIVGKTLRRAECLKHCKGEGEWIAKTEQ